MNKYITQEHFDRAFPAVTTSTCDAELELNCAEEVLDTINAQREQPFVEPHVITAALNANGCERIKEYYSIGPVQRAAVESFADAINAQREQPAASKSGCLLNCYEECVAQTHGCASECPAPSDFTLRPKMPEPQAQAGETKVVAWLDSNTGRVSSTLQDERLWAPLITLQSHREAMADLETACFNRYSDAIAKKDAALKAMGNALEKYRTETTDGSNGSFRVCCVTRSDEPHANYCEATAAITQGQEALK